MLSPIINTMRIQDGSSPLYAAENTAASASAKGNASDGVQAFPEVLKNFLSPSATPAALQTTHLQIHLDLRTQTQNDRVEEQASETLTLEKNEINAEQDERREDEYIEDILEDQEAMEDLIDAWEERGEREEDLSIEKEEAHEEIQKEDIIDEIDEEALEQHHLHDDPQDKPKDERPAFVELEVKKSKSAGSGASEALQERDLTYQEIQMLMETTLQSKNRLQRRVRRVLQSLLESLAQGQRFLLDQHRLAGLDQAEWKEITQLFPPRFYGGLVRQAMLAEGTRGVNQLYDQLQRIQAQTPPRPEDLQFWQRLWEPILGEWPLLMNSWWKQQPLLGDTETLKNMLEMLQHRNALPPGAMGQTLSLALAYQHSPETLERLFVLTQRWLYHQPLSHEDIAFFSEKVYERCYPQDLSDRGQTLELLQKVLTGQSLAEQELLELLQGCNQGVLSYLPTAYLPAELQELQDYVLRDLLGKEEAVLQLLMDADHPR